MKLWRRCKLPASNEIGGAGSGTGVAGVGNAGGVMLGSCGNATTGLAKDGTGTAGITLPLPKFRGGAIGVVAPRVGIVGRSEENIELAPGVDRGGGLAPEIGAGVGVGGAMLIGVLGCDGGATVGAGDMGNDDAGSESVNLPGAGEGARAAG